MINLMLFLLLSHFIGDYYLQSQKLSDDKLRSFRSIIIHSLIYLIPFVITVFVYLISFKSAIYFLILIIPIIHFIIDSVKYFLRNYNLKEVTVYFCDQVLHILSLYLLYIFIFKNNFTDFVNVDLKTYLSWILIIVMIAKPANITFKVCTSSIKYNNKDEESKSKTGGIIGTFERILFTIFLHLSTWEAIGLLFTGKSVTRYNKIRNDEDFADYFLIGTIYSVIISIFVYYFVLKMLPKLV